MTAKKPSTRSSLRTLEGYFSIEYNDCHSQATYENARAAWQALCPDGDWERLAKLLSEAPK